jgi:hypothetical protein
MKNITLIYPEKSSDRKLAKITHVRSKNYSRVQQKLLTCAAKITRVCSKNYSCAQQELRIERQNNFAGLSALEDIYLGKRNK